MPQSFWCDSLRMRIGAFVSYFPAADSVNLLGWLLRSMRNSRLRSFKVVDFDINISAFIQLLYVVSRKKR